MKRLIFSKESKSKCKNDKNSLWDTTLGILNFITVDWDKFLQL